MAEVDANAYAVTTANAAAGASNSIETQQPGGSGALRQVMTLGDAVTRTNIAKVNSDGGLLVAGTQPSGTSVAWTSATTVNTALTQTVTGYNTVSYAVTTTTTLTGGVITFEVFEPLTNAWYPLQAARINSYNTESVYTLIASTNQAWSTSVDGFTQTRIRLSTAITGTATVTVSISPQTFAIEPIVTVGQATAASLQATVAQGTAGASPWLTRHAATTTNSGLLVSKVLSAATTNATLIASGLHAVYGYHLVNNSTSTRYLRFYNQTTAPTVGTNSPSMVIPLPASGGAVFTPNTTSLPFATGLAYSITGGAPDLDATAIAANDVVGTIWYI